MCSINDFYIFLSFSGNNDDVDVVVDLVVDAVDVQDADEYMYEIGDMDFFNGIITTLLNN